MEESTVNNEEMVILDELEKSQERLIDSIKDDKDTSSSKQDQHMEKVIKTSVDVTKVTNFFTILSDKLYFHNIAYKDITF